MPKLTRDGIAKDIMDSPYSVRLPHTTMIFTFSSRSYLNKFLKQYENNRKILEESLSQRFGITIHMNSLSDLVLYMKIEKRGFNIGLIRENEVIRVCHPNSLLLNGEHLTKKN